VTERLPVVAVVGRPNVGKSSLVNRVLGRREAIVEPTPGVTRDRLGYVAEWAGRRFEIFDTGGLERGADGLEARVAEQAQIAIEAADVVVLVVDAQTGPMEDDAMVAAALRRAGRPVVLAANKVDDRADEPLAAAFYGLGVGDPLPVSALHGRGSGDFLDALVSKLPAASEAIASEWGAAAIVGRPNVGKSSILNTLLRADRSIVDAVPGTTRDPVDSHLDLDDGRRLRLVDTAGLRREVLVKERIEYFGLVRTRRALRRCDAAILVMDVSEGVTGHDQRIAEAVLETGRACVLVLNKWDLLPADPADRKRLERDVTERLRFLSWATVVRTSARTRRGVDRILPAVEESIEAHRLRLPTAEINRAVGAAQEARPPPRVGGRTVRILYAVQAQVSPPTVVLFCSGTLPPAYLRYIENRLRADGSFAGTPLRIEVRQRTRRKLKV
jgi:GTP-binding protein